MHIDQRFQKGIELFNKEKFFECHEVIESLWLATDDEYRDLYKGLIQAAVALHHLKKENLSGVAQLFETSVSYLSKYPGRCLGLNVKKLISDLQTCFRTIETQKPKKPFSSAKLSIPKLDFRVDSY